MVANITDPNYTGSTTATLVISPAAATVTLADLTQTYDGHTKPVTAMTDPESLSVAITYDGDTNAPTNAGSYTVVANISDPNYTGSTTGTLAISPAAATITLANLAQTYDGNPKPASATTDPEPLTVAITYNGDSTAPTNAGSYAVVANITDPNYTGSTTDTLVISPAAATITLANLTQTYDGTPKPASATTDPESLSVAITYDGDTTAPPTNAGSYTVTADITDPNYTGSTTATLVIEPAAATLTLTALTLTYDGNPKPASATTEPDGLTVAIIYNGNPTAPTNAGSYTVAANITDPNYTGSATATLVIAPATATINLTDLAQTYDGNPKPASATTDPEGLTLAITYNGDTTAPTNAGSYAVVANITDPNYTGSTTDTLVIEPAAATVTLTNLAQTYDGNPKPTTATTDPESLTLAITYAGNNTAPTNAGSYAVVATVTDPNYTGSTTATLVISPAAATITLGGLAQTYDGNPKPASATTDPEGLTIAITYDTENNAPTNAGSYTVTADITDPNYTGSTTATLVITPSTATITLNGLTQTYDSNPKPVTATTDPEGLTIAITYDTENNAPTNAGSYTVTADITDPNYTGSTTATLVITPSTATITLNGLTQTYDSNPKPVTATTDPEGLTIAITYDTENNAPTNAGSYAVVATVTDPNYTGSTTGTLVIAPAEATLTLAGLNQTYDGTPKPTSATTDPDGLSAAITYNGDTTAPTDSGSYTVVANITDPNYTGSTTATLAISPAAATVTLAGLAQTYDGTPKPITSTTDPEALIVAITYDAKNTAPTNAGSYEVVANITDPNYTGSTTATLVISPAAATVTLADLTQTYDGHTKPVTAMTDPESLSVAITYDGDTNAPTNAGSYTVVANISDPNYTGSTTGTLAISPAAATITLANLAQTYDGNPKPASATTDPEGLTVAITYNGDSTAPTNAGSYTVVANITAPNYNGSTTATLIISPAAATITLAGLNQTYDGNPKPTSATTEPDGLTLAITYNGDSTAPTKAGSYAVVANITDPNYTGSTTSTLAISPAAATITLANLAQTYDGNPKPASATTDPEALTVAITYDGDSTAPTNAGSYTVTADITDPNYTGSTTGTLAISPAAATLTLADLAQTYDGTPKPASATTDPEALTLAITYNGDTNAPTDAGSYTVVANITDPNYTGSTTATLVIEPAAATLTLTGLTQTYDSNPNPVTATTDPESLSVAITYDGDSTAPTNAGSYAVVATVTDPNYTGSTTATLVIEPAAATLTLGDLTKTYDGNPKPASATTEPDGLTLAITYNGDTTAPTNAGSYTVAANITAPNYTGSTTGTLAISPAAATITLTGLAQTYDGTPKPASATTDPESLSVAITYDGNPTVPTNAGSYAVVANITDPNYAGSATATLVISPATAALTLAGLNQTYDGNPKPASATTDPEALTVAITYDGDSTAPTNAGSYAVVANITDPNYAGSATATLVISPATATLTLGDLTKTYDGNPKPASATTEPDGLTLAITYNGDTTAPTNAGSYTVAANITDPNYTGSTTGTLAISPAAATITLTGLAQTYDGTPKPASATTDPESLSVAITYDGNPTVPTNAGSYAVVANITDPNYAGSATATLVISPATAALTLAGLNQTYDGNPKPASATTDPEALTVAITYDGDSTAPTNAGSYAVVANITDPNYAGSATATLVISPATAALTLAGLNQTYDGNPKPASAATDPEGLTVAITYNGDTTAPTDAGSYAVTANITDPNYTGSTSAIMVIEVSYIGWMEGFITPAPDSRLDSDGDGWSNLAEYLFDTDPFTPSSAPSLKTVHDESTFQLHLVPDPKERPDAFFGAQTSTDLSNWTSESITPVANGFSIPNSGLRLFIKLTFSQSQ